jgi:hypothetical protein
MRKTLTTVALMLALSCPALAGEMHTPGSPTPPPSSATQEPTADGIIHGDKTDSLTQTALDLLAVLPSLL